MLNIESQLNSFQAISLAEMDSVRLMDRVDTKFAISMAELPKLLHQLKGIYHVLEINGLRLPSYESMYFDDEQFSFYKAHHNGREERFKVRIRNYVESGLYFLEVKHRLKGRVVKKRIRINGFEKDLSEVEFPVLADTNHALSRAYEVLNEDNGEAERGTFIIDPKGLLRYVVISDSNVGRSVDETLRVLKALQTGGLCPIDWEPGQSNL